VVEKSLMKRETNFKLLELILIVIFCILIWFVGDDIQIKQWEPLANPKVRLIVIATIGFFWTLKLVLNSWLVKHAEKKLATSFLQYGLKKVKKNDPAAMQQFKIQIKQLTKNLKAWQVISGKKRIDLQNLPWFLVMGTSNSGKTQLLERSGLNFSLLTRSSKSDHKQAFEIPWYATENAVFLKYSQVEIKEDLSEVNDETSHVILNTLKQYKKGATINGLIVAVGIDELLNGSSEERQKKIDSLRGSIKNLYEIVKVRFPVYLAITKCDSIPGFLEYFGHYSLEEREQAIGLTLINSTKGEEITTELNTYYDNLVGQLKSKLLRLLEQQPDIAFREKLCFFPEQMALLKSSIVKGILSVLIPNKLYEIIDFRGVYFTSVVSENTTICNPFGEMMSQKFGLSLNSPREISKTNAFFIKKLFQEVIIPEAWLVEQGRIWYRFRSGIQFLFYGLTITAVLLPILALMGGVFL